MPQSFYYSQKILVLLTAIGWSILSFAPTANAELIGLVQKVLDVNYGTPPGTAREQKFLRFPIVQNEFLETSDGGGISVEFLDETLFTLGPSSSLVIDTFVYDPNLKEATTVLKLSIGVMRIISGRLNYAKTRIITPTTSIGFRGSDAIVRVAANGSTSVAVLDGEFSVSNSDGSDSVNVSASQSVSVSATGQVGAVSAGPTSAPADVNIPAQTVGRGGSGGGVSPGAGGDDPGGGQDGGDDGKVKTGYKSDHGLDDDHHDDEGYDHDDGGDDHDDDHHDDGDDGGNGH